MRAALEREHRPRKSVAQVAARLLVLPVTLALISCAGAGTPAKVDVELDGEDASTIAVAPFNLVIALPTPLETSTEFITTILSEWIEAQGKVVERIDYRTSRALWVESIQAASRSDKRQTFETAAGIFSQKLRERVEFDALIIPSIFLQSVKRRGLIARWDGARQRIDAQGGRFVGNACIRSKLLKGVSLLVHVFDDEGKPILSKQAGLELLHHVETGPDPQSEGNPMSCWIVVNKPALQDENRVRTGIASGLFPFLRETDVPPKNEEDSGQ